MFVNCIIIANQFINYLLILMMFSYIFIKSVKKKCLILFSFVFSSSWFVQFIIKSKWIYNIFEFLFSFYFFFLLKFNLMTLIILLEGLSIIVRLSFVLWIWTERIVIYSNCLQIIDGYNTDLILIVFWCEFFI